MLDVGSFTLVLNCLCLVCVSSCDMGRCSWLTGGHENVQDTINISTIPVEYIADLHNLLQTRIEWAVQPQSMRSLAFNSAQLGRVACSLCGKLVRPAKMKRHLIIHTGQKPFECPHCHHKTNRKENLDDHIRRRHYRDLATP